MGREGAASSSLFVAQPGAELAGKLPMIGEELMPPLIALANVWAASDWNYMAGELRRYDEHQIKKILRNRLRPPTPFDNLGESPDGKSNAGGSIRSKVQKNLAKVEEV